MTIIDFAKFVVIAIALFKHFVEIFYFRIAIIELIGGYHYSIICQCPDLLEPIQVNFPYYFSSAIILLHYLVLTFNSLNKSSIKI